MYKTMRVPLALLACFLLAPAALAEEPAFRTDADGDERLPWFQIQPGEFPPEGSAHYYSGELIALDHVNRRGTLRVDRTDAQRRSHWDLPVDFRLLPYGAIYYHGAPAALRDIPIGTHLHGLFYIKDPSDPGMKPEFYNRESLEVDFNQAFLLEDDFSHYARKKRAWRIDAIDRETGELTAVEVDLDGGRPAEKPSTFDIVPATRVWQGRRIATPADLAPGQIVQLNLTWATLFGPGRCTNVWIDDESRAVATAQQLAVHHQHQRERGLAGWVDEVDNQKRIVTVTLFGGVDSKLLESLQPNTTVTAVVAEPSLRSYDQVNDRKGGPLLSVESIPVEPGSSGVQIRFQPSLLLEGFRPDRIVRIFPSGWPIESIPQEERLWPARD
ncbi:MAG: hypothetical protein RIC55_16905 [Pirellulaceae bacterium]